MKLLPYAQTIFRVGFSEFIAAIYLSEETFVTIRNVTNSNITVKLDNIDNESHYHR